MTRRNAVAAIVPALLVSLALAPEAGACSCATAPEADRFEGSDGAVVVRLTDVVVTDPGYSETHVYRVLRVYRGPPSLERRETLRLETSSQSSACGLGRGTTRRGLYLYGRPGRWGSNSCSQTRPAAMRRAAERSTGRATGPSGGCGRA